MTTPATAIKLELQTLMDFQIETFGQPASLTPLQLCEFHHRTEKIGALFQQLNRIGAMNFIERRFERSSG